MFLRPVIQRAMSTAAAPASRYFVLTYKYPDDILERRAPHREAHLKYVQQFVDNGKMLLGGALVDPIDSAVIVFRVGDKEEVERFAKGDPYVLNGVALEWAVREWNVVVGTKHDK